MIKKILYCIKKIIKVKYVKLKYGSYIQEMCSFYHTFMTSYRINGGIDTTIQTLTMEELEVLYRASKSRDKLIMVRYYELYLAKQERRSREIEDLAKYYENELEQIKQDSENVAVDMLMEELKTLDCRDIMKKANHTLVQLAVHDIDRKMREFIDNNNS